MIRTTAVPSRRALRVGAAAASVAGIALLAGCSGAATAEETEAQNTPAPSATSEPVETTAATDAATTSTYADGSYTADGTYVDGGGVSETISVTISLEGDVVTDVEVTGDAASPQSRQYQEAFIGGISDEVVGKEIDALSVSKVAGSSLTSGGFNDALETIKSEAQA